MSIKNTFMHQNSKSRDYQGQFQQFYEINTPQPTQQKYRSYSSFSERPEINNSPTKQDLHQYPYQVNQFQMKQKKDFIPVKVYSPANKQISIPDMCNYYSQNDNFYEKLSPEQIMEHKKILEDKIQKVQNIFDSKIIYENKIHNKSQTQQQDPDNQEQQKITIQNLIQKNKQLQETINSNIELNQQQNQTMVELQKINEKYQILLINNSCLQQKIKGFQKAHDNYNQLLNQKDQNNVAIQQSNEQYNIEKREQKEQIEILNLKNSELDQENQQLKVELHSQYKNIENQTRDLNFSLIQIENMKNEYQNLMNLNLDLNQEKQDFNQKFQIYTDEQNNNFKQFFIEKNNLQSKFNELQTEKQLLQEQLQVEIQNKNYLKEENEQLYKNFEQLQQEQNNNQNPIIQFQQQEYCNLLKKYQEMENELKQLQKSNESEIIQKQNKQISYSEHLINQNNILQSQNDKLKQQFQDQSTKIQEYEKQLKNKSQGNKSEYNESEIIEQKNKKIQELQNINNNQLNQLLIIKQEFQEQKKLMLRIKNISNILENKSNFFESNFDQISLKNEEGVLENIVNQEGLKNKPNNSQKSDIMDKCKTLSVNIQNCMRSTSTGIQVRKVFKKKFNLSIKKKQSFQENIFDEQNNKIDYKINQYTSLQSSQQNTTKNFARTQKF